VSFLLWGGGLLHFLCVSARRETCAMVDGKARFFRETRSNIPGGKEQVFLGSTQEDKKIYAPWQKAGAKKVPPNEETLVGGRNRSCSWRLGAIYQGKEGKTASCIGKKTRNLSAKKNISKESVLSRPKLHTGREKRTAPSIASKTEQQRVKRPPRKGPQNQNQEMCCPKGGEEEP